MTTIKGLMILIFLMLNSVLFSQAGMLFSGRVLDHVSHKLLEKASLEINGHYQSLSIHADFSIYVDTYDTITFTHLGYTPIEIIITDSTTIQDLPRVISLEVNNITLDEFEVHSFVLNDEMRGNAQQNVKSAVQQAKNREGLTYRRSNPESGQSGTGLSTSQMFGLNLFSIVDLVQESQKEPVTPSITRIITYEEYMSSQ